MLAPYGLQLLAVGAVPLRPNATEHLATAVPATFAIFLVAVPEAVSADLETLGKVGFATAVRLKTGFAAVVTVCCRVVTQPHKKMLDYSSLHHVAEEELCALLSPDAMRL